MSQAGLQFIAVGKRRIAAIVQPAPGARCGLLWLPGLKSDMASTKASALAEFAAGKYAMTRFDYSGHGQSEGRFEDGTIGAWLEDALAVFTHLTARPTVVVGSSMGGYLALLLLAHALDRDRALAARIKALVLIAPAWDMTELLMWRAFTPYQQAALAAEGYVLRPSDYGEPYKLSRALIEEGRSHLIGARPFEPGRPVHIFQGGRDTAVPPAHTRRLLQLLRGPGIVLEEIADGDHRLSRPDDIARLLAVIARLADAPDEPAR